MPFPTTKKLSLRDALSSARETRALEIGPGVLRLVPRVFGEYFPGASAIVVADTITNNIAGKAVAESLAAAGQKTLPPFIFADPKIFAEFSYVTELENALKQHDAIPIAVGSGTINDLTKLAAFRTGRPYMSVATAASMDGYTAFGASITYQGSKQTFNCPAPVAVVADLDILRHAPREMTASGYADLMAKITAGADWLIADALGVEPIAPQAWNIVQGGLRESLENPAALAQRDATAMAGLTEGLMLGGFAMQWSKTSRPASGAEHQFSHLWDMQHHEHNGATPSHGFKVGIATLAVTALYEYLLTQPIEQLDVFQCCVTWPDDATVEEGVRKLFAWDDFTDKAVEETKAKSITRINLELQLELLKRVWPELKTRLRDQLIPYAELKQRLQQVGAPVEPEQIGIPRARLRDSFRQAYHIRRRFTILDLMIRAGLLEKALAHLFGPQGPWPIETKAA